jgi:hypothetical protein
MTSKSNKRGGEMPPTYPSLTEDALPGVRRAWREVVVTLREHPGQWYVIEEGVTRSRAKSIRKAVRYHDGIQVSQRQQKEDGTIAVYARAIEENP